MLIYPVRSGALSIERNEGGTVRWYLAPTTAPAPESKGKPPSVSAVAVNGRMRAFRNGGPSRGFPGCQAGTHMLRVLAFRLARVVGKKL
jgi:hypothetical protein